MNVTNLFPAPPDLFARFRQPNGTVERVPVIALVLTRQGEVKGLWATDTGFDFFESCNNFEGYTPGRYE